MDDSTPDDPTAEEVYTRGKVYMNRASKRLGVLTDGGPEDRRFRSFFGVGVVVFITAYKMLLDHGLYPAECNFQHYFWAMIFMKLYPQNEAGLCSILGGIDAKTMRRGVWPIIGALALLDEFVVSAIILILYRH